MRIGNAQPRAIVAFDTGLGTFGMAAVDPTARALLAVGCFESSKASKKHNVSDSSDLTHRTVRLAGAVSRFCDQFDVVALAHEALSWPRSSRAAAMLGMSVGVLVAVSQIWDVPILEVSPQDLKDRVVGRRTATKADVLAALAAKPGFERVAELVAGLHIKASLVEHPVDAAAVGFCVLDHDMIRVLRRAA